MASALSRLDVISCGLGAAVLLCLPAFVTRVPAPVDLSAEPAVLISFKVLPDIAEAGGAGEAEGGPEAVPILGILVTPPGGSQIALSERDFRPDGSPKPRLRLPAALKLVSLRVGAPAPPPGREPGPSREVGREVRLLIVAPRPKTWWFDVVLENNDARGESITRAEETGRGVIGDLFNDRKPPTFSVTRTVQTSDSTELFTETRRFNISRPSDFPEVPLGAGGQKAQDGDAQP